MSFKKIFLDTCVLSDIGRMESKEREELAFKFTFKWEFQIIITSYNLIELERWKEKEYRENVYDFLDKCFLGYASDFSEVFRNEITSEEINIIKFPICTLMNNMLNFKEYKNELFNYAPFLAQTKMYDNIIIDLQEHMNDYEKEYGLVSDQQHINAQISNIYGKYGKEIPKNYNKIYNNIPGIYTYYYSYVKKIKSADFKKRFKEFDDVSMSYLTPYMDIVITERKQYARYIELKQNSSFNGLESVIIKKHGDVIKNIDGSYLFQLDI